MRVQASFMLLGFAATACAANADLGGASGDSGVLADGSGLLRSDGSASDGSRSDGSNEGDGAPDVGDPDVAPIPLADLCPVFTEDLCTFLIQCDKTPYRDMSQCLAENDCYGLPQLTLAASQGAVLYDPSKVGACNARFRSDPCGFASFLFATDIFYVLSLCPGTLTPELKQGDACVSDGECQSGLFCSKQNDICPGTCIPYSTVGQPCDTNGMLCAQGLLCNESNTCELQGALGAHCTTDEDCSGSGIYICLGDAQCDPPPVLWCNTSNETCTAGVASGGACGTADAGSRTCADGLSCTAVIFTGTCAAPGGAGTPCSGDEGCQTGLHCSGFEFVESLGQCAPPGASGSSCNGPTYCASGLFCEYNAQGLDGTCSPPSGVGGACLDSDTDCQTGLTCSNEICMSERYPGDSCSDANSLCILSQCKNGVCVNYAKVGAACGADNDCFTSACVGGTCADTTVCADPGDGG